MYERLTDSRALFKVIFLPLYSLVPTLGGGNYHICRMQVRDATFYEVPFFEQKINFGVSFLVKSQEFINFGVSFKKNNCLGY